MAESIVFDAQVALEEGDLAPRRRARLRGDGRRPPGRWCAPSTPTSPTTPDAIVREFKTRFYDTELFFDRFAKGRFARPLLRPPRAGPRRRTRTRPRASLVEESQLFIDAVHAMEIREAGAQSALV